MSGQLAEGTRPAEGRHPSGGQTALFSPRVDANAVFRPMGAVSCPRGIQDSLLIGSTVDIVPRNAPFAVVRQARVGGKDDHGVSLQGCHRAGGSGHPGILFPLVLLSQKERRVETDTQSETVEQVCAGTLHEDGDSSIGERAPSDWGVGGVDRPERRLPTCSYPQGTVEVPALPIRRPGVRISSPAVRIGHESTGLYPSGEGAGRTSASVRGSNAQLFGRLVDPSVVRAGMSDVSRHSHGHSAPVGIYPKLGEVGLGAVAKIHLFGSGFQPRGCVCSADRESHSQFQDVGATSCRGAVHYGAHAPCPVGTYGILGGPSSTDKAVQETTPVAFVPGVGQSQLGSGDSVGGLVCPAGAAVPGGQVFDRSRPVAPLDSRVGIVHRCLPRGVRCTFGGPTVNRDMGGYIFEPPHQPVGIGSGATRLHSIPESNSTTSNFVENGQYYGSRVHQQMGGYKVRGSRSQCVADTRASGFVGSCFDSETYPRVAQCVGGLTEQAVTCQYRVDASQGGGAQSYPGVGQPTGGFVCNTTEQPVASVCVTGTRHTGTRLRCVERGLDGVGSVCLPPSDPSRQSLGEGQKTTLPNDASGTRLDSAVLVSSVVPTFSGGAGSVTGVSGVAQSTDAQGLAQNTGGVQATRMETIQHSLRGRGISGEVAQLVSNVKRQSTERVYECHWNAWVRWAIREHVDPLSPVVNDLAQYFLSLVRVKKLSLGTVKSHRTAIFTTLRQCGRKDFSGNLILHDLLMSLEKTSVRPLPLPKWDVFLVLDMLKRPPFEPLHIVGLKWLTYKTIFLVALAACRRISEIHAFLYDLVEMHHDKSVVLRTDPLFIAKNQAPGEEFPPTRIHSLSDTLSRRDTDRLICPVRALRYYLSRTVEDRKGRKKFFIPFQRKEGEITKNSLSRWIATTIRLAYEGSAQEVHSVKPHEIRAISASLNFHDSLDVVKVMSAGFWKGRHTFDRFYFRDMAVGPDGIRRIHSVIAGQELVSVRRATQRTGPIRWRSK